MSDDVPREVPCERQKAMLTAIAKKGDVGDMAVFADWLEEDGQPERAKFWRGAVEGKVGGWEDGAHAAAYMLSLATVPHH